jgi:hypothetical protein
MSILSMSENEVLVSVLAPSNECGSNARRQCIINIV